MKDTFKEFLLLEAARGFDVKRDYSLLNRKIGSTILPVFKEAGVTPTSVLISSVSGIPTTTIDGWARENERRSSKPGSGEPEYYILFNTPQQGAEDRDEKNAAKLTLFVTMRRLKKTPARKQEILKQFNWSDDYLEKLITTYKDKINSEYQRMSGMSGDIASYSLTDTSDVRNSKSLEAFKNLSNDQKKAQVREIVMRLRRAGDTKITAEAIAKELYDAPGRMNDTEFSNLVRQINYMFDAREDKDGRLINRDMHDLLPFMRNKRKGT